MKKLKYSDLDGTIVKCFSDEDVENVFNLVATYKDLECKVLLPSLLSNTRVLISHTGSTNISLVKEIRITKQGNFKYVKDIK